MNNVHKGSMISRTALILRRQGVRSQAHCLRLYSTPSSPSPKICSVPFKQRPEDVMPRLHIAALFASARFGNLVHAGLLRLFGSAGQMIAEALGLGKTLRLSDMKAVYYPVWRCDVFLEGKAWTKGRKSETTMSSSLGIKEFYVPGNSFAPLSYLSFSVPPLEADLPQYNPAADLKQLGEGFNIVQVPFSASPMGLAKLIRDSVGAEPESGGVVFDTESWKEKILACYPILFPIYSAEFEFEAMDGTQRSINIVMDAHDSQIQHCRISFPPLPEVVERSTRLKENYYINPVTFVPEMQALLPTPRPEDIERPSEGAIQSPKLVEMPDLPKVYSRYMSPPITSATSIAPSPMVEVERSEGGVNWDDVRIQAWNGEEREQNGAYIDALQNYSMLKRSLQTMREERNLQDPKSHGEQVTVGVVKIGGGGLPKFEKISINDMIKQYEEDEKAAIKQAWETRPMWLKKFTADSEKLAATKEKSLP